MKLFFINRRAVIFVLTLSLAASFWFGAHPGVHAQEQLAKQSGRVNDLAAVLDATTGPRLEKVLVNLEQRTGIDFVIVTVKSTGSEDLYDYSLRIAKDWSIGVPTSPKKSILLVIAGDNGKFLAQISKGARTDLPDGLMGEMGQRMRAKIESAGFSEGLLSGIKTLADGLGERNNFSFADLDRHPVENLIAEQQRPRTIQSPTAESTATPAARVTETPRRQQLRRSPRRPPKLPRLSQPKLRNQRPRLRLQQQLSHHEPRQRPPGRRRPP